MFTRVLHSDWSRAEVIKICLHQSQLTRRKGVWVTQSCLRLNKKCKWSASTFTSLGKKHWLTWLDILTFSTERFMTLMHVTLVWYVQKKQKRNFLWSITHKSPITIFHCIFDPYSGGLQLLCYAVGDTHGHGLHPLVPLQRNVIVRCSEWTTLFSDETFGSRWVGL